MNQLHLYTVYISRLNCLQLHTFNKFKSIYPYMKKCSLNCFCPCLMPFYHLITGNNDKLVFNMTQTVLCHLINHLDLSVFTSISVAKTIYAKTARVIYRSHSYAIDEFMITVVNQNLFAVIYIVWYMKEKLIPSK